MAIFSFLHTFKQKSEALLLLSYIYIDKSVADKRYRKVRVNLFPQQTYL